MAFQREVSVKFFELAHQGQTDACNNLIKTSAQKEESLHRSSFSRKLSMKNKPEGTFVNMPNEDGLTPLVLAASLGLHSVVAQLIKSGAVIDLPCSVSGVTALHEAVCRNRYYVALKLLELGANPEVKTFVKFITPLHLAAAVGNDRIVRLLLNKDIDLDPVLNDGCTPLYLACQEGATDCVKVLLHQGANLHLRNHEEKSCLYIAAAWGHEAIVRLLLQLGADPGATTLKGHSALYVAAGAGYAEVVKTLLTHTKCDVNHQNKEGATALHCAAERGHLDVVEVLLHRGANPSLLTLHGSTAEYLAVKAGEDAVAQRLRRDPLHGPSSVTDDEPPQKGMATEEWPRIKRTSEL